MFMLPRNGLSIRDFSQAMSALFPAMRFSWEIKSVDAVFCNGLSRFFYFVTPPFEKNITI